MTKRDYRNLAIPLPFTLGTPRPRRTSKHRGFLNNLTLTVHFFQSLSFPHHSTVNHLFCMRTRRSICSSSNTTGKRTLRGCTSGGAVFHRDFHTRRPRSAHDSLETRVHFAPLPSGAAPLSTGEAASSGGAMAGRALVAVSIAAIAAVCLKVS